MINLLPPNRLLDMRVARSNTILRRYINLSLISLLVLALGLAATYYYFQRQLQNTQQSSVLTQAKLKQLEPIQKQAQQLSTTVTTIAGLLSRDVKFSDLLTKIGGLTPSGTVLTGLQFSIEDLKSPLVISAQVDSEEKAAILRNNLAGSPLFSKAEIQTITKGDGAATGTAGVPSNQQTSDVADENSDYPFTAVIKAYFKDANAIGSGAKK